MTRGSWSVDIGSPGVQDSVHVERCQSGRLGTPGERVYPKGTVGSNPTLSAVTMRRTGCVARAPGWGYENSRTDDEDE